MRGEIDWKMKGDMCTLLYLKQNASHETITKAMRIGQIERGSIFCLRYPVWCHLPHEAACLCAKSTQSCPTVCEPMTLCSSLGSSVHGIRRWPTGIWKDAQHCSLVERQIDTARRYHLIPIRMAIIRQLMNNMLERVWRRGKPSYTVEGTGNWCSHCRKQYGSSSKKSKNRVSIWSNNSSPEHISGKKLYLEKIHAPLCS